LANQPLQLTEAEGRTRRQVAKLNQASMSQQLHEQNPARPVPVLLLFAESELDRMIVSIFKLLLHARGGLVTTERQVPHMPTEYRGHGTRQKQNADKKSFTQETKKPGWRRCEPGPFIVRQELESNSAANRG